MEKIEKMIRDLDSYYLFRGLPFPSRAVRGHLSLILAVMGPFPKEFWWYD